jgi:hypothetical protein
MKPFTLKIVLLIISLIVAGILMNFFQTLQGHEAKMIRTLDGEGNTRTSNVLSPTTGYFFLDVSAKLCYASATSIFIAVFISSRITASNQAKREEELKELQSAVNKDVFNSLFQSLMPSELFQAVKTQLIQREVMVRGAEWHYEFENDDRDPEFLRGRITIRYAIHNLSSKRIIEKFRLVSMEYPDSDFVLQEAICKRKGDSLFHYKHGAGETNSFVTEHPNYQEDPFKTMLELDVEIPAQDQADLILITSGRYKTPITDAYFIKYPMVDGKLMFQFPKGYEFSLFPSVSAQVKPGIKASNKRTFDFHGGILPQQGFAFFLKKEAVKTDFPQSPSA